MGSFSSKSKTTSNSTTTSSPLDQYAPYINQGLSSAQKVFNDNQGNLQDIGKKALDVYGGLGQVGGTLANIYTGKSPSQATYRNLQNASANDTSIPILQQLAGGSTSPGQYDAIGAGNPALSLLSGMSHGQANGDTSQFYKDTLSGKYLNNNPYIDQIAQQGSDAALKAVNQRFAASGMGEGLSTPYAQAAGDSITNANNNLRYGAYNNELQRMGQIGGQSDSQYNSTQDRNLSAATGYGSLFNQTGALNLSAQQAKDSAFQNDRASQLAAAQSLGGQNNANNATSLSAANGDLQSVLSASQLADANGGAQLSALGAAGSLPFTGVNSYADLINALTAKYGTTNSSGTSTTTSNPGFGNVLGSLAGSALSGWATGGFKL